MLTGLRMPANNRGAAAELPAEGPVELAVPASLEGERIDRALALLLGVSRAKVAALMAAGRAKVGGKVVTSASRRLAVGERLQVQQPSFDDPASPEPLAEAPPGAEAVLAPSVVYADADLVVVDKPPGLVVHPGAGNATGTLVQQLVGIFPAMAGVGPDRQRPGIVHRLDKGTSGLLVVALSDRAQQHLAAQMAARTVHRRYLAVVHGEVEADEGIIEAPVGRSPSQRLKMAVREGGRSARTRYSVIERSAVPLPCTLIRCALETGRTHQIRVHMAAIGHPVLADDRYSSRPLLDRAREVAPGLLRPWLHAAELAFVHPVNGEPVEYSAEVPADLAEALEQLRLSGRSAR